MNMSSPSSCFHNLLERNVVEYTEMKELHFAMLTLKFPVHQNSTDLFKMEVDGCSHDELYFLPKLHRDDLLTLLELYRFFVHVAKKSNATFYLSGGSLIGQVRHDKRLIPWDDDIDVVISQDDLHIFTVTFGEEVERFNRTTKTFKLTEPKFNYYYDGMYKLYDSVNFTKVYDLYNFPFVDVFVFVKSGTVVIDEDKSSYKQILNSDVIFPLIRDKFLGEEIYLPYNVSEYLSCKSFMNLCQSRKYFHKYDHNLRNRKSITKNCGDLEFISFYKYI
ncbi:hypothetical protein HELRODRAFT_180130 [Helobdella robusta]|uniref:LicD/FKTN/FKRP nucleotidyltransferase domain-containing protein n=1 Tax=Helobdella robusta TaxID=6412 RepID=T1FFI1_HELRO|nr:hypothetical protein HELRODRAFT_180130 [Helobdella robusta]ESN94788.1 hypothetical protein HELRODRAFT_180130 [Helobdella robusta]